jgi:hypothetical protein
MSMEQKDHSPEAMTETLPLRVEVGFQPVGNIYLVGAGIEPGVLACRIGWANSLT